MTESSKFKQIVLEILAEHGINLNEHAKHLDYAEDKITELGENISDHLLTCLLFGPNDIDYEHWLDEIRGWFISVNRIKLKINNKSPDLNKVIKWLTDGITDSDDALDINIYTNIIDRLVSKYTNKLPIGRVLLKKQPNEFLDLYINIIKNCYKSNDILNNLKKCCKNWFDKYSNIYNKFKV